MLSKVIDNEHMLKILSEFNRLGDKCYLDHAGTALYPETLINKVNKDLLTNIYMNPHSDKHTNDCIEQIRYTVLQHFNTDPSKYTVIFTSGATQALKLVAESFNFECDEYENFVCGSFVYLRDNHTSVLGLRELVKEKKVNVVHISKQDFLQTIDSSSVSLPVNEEYKYHCNTLFVYPAQSSFNGFKYPIDCIDKIKFDSLNKYNKHNKVNAKNIWYILLDAASYVSTNHLDLTKCQPDFMCLSFYKLFGFPTGLGALLVKNSSADVLSRKKYFGGGTVDVVLASEDYHIKRTQLYESSACPYGFVCSRFRLKHQCYPPQQQYRGGKQHYCSWTIGEVCCAAAGPVLFSNMEVFHTEGDEKLANLVFFNQPLYDMQQETYKNLVVVDLGSNSFEDGTIPFLSILSLKHCFDVLLKIIPKQINNHFMETISYHTFYLAKDLYEQLKSLRHKNGRQAAILYMDSSFEDIKKQGGIVTFNLLRADGTYIGYSEFQQIAELFNINIRTGCFCNSGSCQRHLKLNNEDIKEMYKFGHKCGNDVDLVDGKPTGCIRISFGYYNTFNDADRLITMICQSFLKTESKKPNRVAKTIDVVEELIINKRKTVTLSMNGNCYFKGSSISGLLDNSKQHDKIFVKEITIFPIKSCGAYKVTSSWEIGLKGFKYDREWMIVKDNGVCLTQKQNTHMCKIRPSFDFKTNQLKLDFPGKEPISVPLEIPLYGTSKHISLCQSKVCTDLVQGYDCGDEVGDWISEALGIAFLRLIRQSDYTTRARKSDTSDIKLSLSNQAQFLLINMATVQWLQDKIKDDSFLDSLEQLADRFRANIVVNSDEELIEREWNNVLIGKHLFKVDGLCSRCHMVCIDQQTGLKTVEPLRTISEQFSGKMKFGIYLSYVGTFDNSNDVILKIDTPVIPMVCDENKSRCNFKVNAEVQGNFVSVINFL